MHTLHRHPLCLQQCPCANQGLVWSPGSAYSSVPRCHLTSTSFLNQGRAAPGMLGVASVAAMICEENREEKGLVGVNRLCSAATGQTGGGKPGGLLRGAGTGPERTPTPSAGATWASSHSSGSSQKTYSSAGHQDASTIAWNAARKAFSSGKDLCNISGHTGSLEKVFTFEYRAAGHTSKLIKRQLN